MLTLLSDTEVHQLHCCLTELTGVVDNLTHILLGAQTVQFEVPAPMPQQPVQVSDTPSTKSASQSQSKTRKSSRKKRAVLNEKKVAEIKQRLAAGQQANTVAREYKVHFSTVHAIKKGRTWKNIQPMAVKPLEILEIRK
jgi:anti-sigma28 factor (negative regulator of flagellin synthesis)